MKCSRAACPRGSVGFHSTRFSGLRENMRNFNRRKIRRNHRHQSNPSHAWEWLQIVAQERAELFASPERVAEIEARQPEAESRGRALLYMPGTQQRESGAQRKRRKDASRY